MFTDEPRNKVWNELRQHGLRAFASILTPQVFLEAASRANVTIGRSALNLTNLAWLGIACAMHRTKDFAFVLTTTLRLLQDCQDFHADPLGKKKGKKKAGKRNNARKRPKAATAKKRGGRKRSKHDPRGRGGVDISEEAFVQARQRMPLEFWTALILLLAEKFQRAHPPCRKESYGFRLLAIDGTLLNLPKSARLLKFFGRPKNGSRKKARPQARMVMLMLPGTRIPIAYELSKLADSELTLAGRLMKHVRANDLLLMDRGFISYGLFWRIQNQGAYFGTRLKKGLNFRDIKQLGKGDKLVEWTPQDSRNQWKGLAKSMRLRVIEYQFPGFRPSAIVTNVLNPRRLSRDAWVQMAANCDSDGKWKPGLYHRRWQIETSYCELKVVLDLKKLRSRTPESVQYEVAGKVLYYLLIRWLIVEAAKKYDLDPLQISFTNAVRLLEEAQTLLVTQPQKRVEETLLPRLLERIASHTVPPRPGRHYPRPNDTKAKDKGGGQKQASAKISPQINTKSTSKTKKINKTKPHQA